MGGGGGGGGRGRRNGKILNGHIFVNTHQNCTKCSVVVYCVDMELISKCQLVCIIYTMISQNSMLTKHAFTEKLRLRKLHEIVYDIVLKFSAIVLYTLSGAMSILDFFLNC